MEKTLFKNIDETLITELLPNGLRINIVPRPGFSKSFAMFTTNYGGADRRFKLGNSFIDTPAGVAHFLEHKMFDMPDGNALNILSSNGASPNAFTSSDITAYYFESTDLFMENLKTLINFVSTPYFTEESVQKEQGIIGQEIRMVEDNPDFVVYNNLLRCLYKYNPVRDSVAGTIESISSITDKVLYHCHEVFYSPSNMCLSVVGDVDPAAVIALAQELLPTVAEQVPSSDYGEAESEFPFEKEKIVTMEVAAPQFLIGAKITPAEKGTPRLKQLLTGEIALFLLFGRSAPLYNDLYASGLLNGAFEYELDYTAGTAMVLVSGEGRDIPEIVKHINAKLSSIAADGLDPSLFANAKKAHYGAELRALGSFSSLATALTVGTFAGYCPLEGIELIEQITLSDVQDFIKSNITPEKLALSVINPTEA